MPTPKQIKPAIARGIAAKPIRNTSQAVLTDYLTVDEIAAAPLEELAQLLAKEGRNRFPSPEATVAAVKRAARDSYRPHPTLNDPLEPDTWCYPGKYPHLIRADQEAGPGHRTGGPEVSQPSNLDTWLWSIRSRDNG